MLTKKYNAKEVEKKWQKFWQEEKIYEFDERSKKPIYSIDTPPPTVNGKIHIGHIFSYSQAEIVARYKRMKGFNVFYPFGFDDNGLPTERLVEKKHGIKAYQTSREYFTELCLAETSALEKQFRNLFVAAGFSCDWNYEYSTIGTKAQITSQKSFIDLYKKGKAYFSEAPALWCSECQTAIAQAELETKELTSIFNYLKFFIGDTDEFVEIATTRPELLAACQCIFVHPEDTRYKRLIGKIVKVPLYEIAVPILEDDKVEMDKGTGAVMCCTFGDLTDLEWYKKHKLKYKEAILPNGTMSSMCGKYEGMSVEHAREEIISELSKYGYIIKQEKIVHNVAVHERCGTPMEITIKKQWFIDILSNKQEYIDAGNKIKWYPEHMKARYQNWVENLEWDWCISRQRYFGVPFPVWYCKECGNTIIAEETELPVNPINTMPHRSCECGCNEFIPEKDILDTWATSSVTPFINLNWFKSDDYKKEMLPMNLRPNAHDIIRTWDFYTIVKSLYHTGELPWNEVMISGHVMAAKSEKFSKSKENSKMEPADIIEQYSADAVRMWAATGSLGNDIVFSEEEFKNANKLITKLWNAAKFIVMHLEGFEKTIENGEKICLNSFNAAEPVELMTMDKWVVEAFNKMVDKYEKYLEKCEIGLALGEVEKFFWSYCDDYIEIIKNRVYKPEIYGENARKSGLYAAYKTLLGIIKCFAIYIPHVTEEIYQGYFREIEKEMSIHKTKIEKIVIDKANYKKDFQVGEIVVDIISKMRRYKSENNLSLKAPIESASITLPCEMTLGDAIDDIKATCSCNAIDILYGKALEVVIMESNNIQLNNAGL